MGGASPTGGGGGGGGGFFRVFLHPTPKEQQARAVHHPPSYDERQKFQVASFITHEIFDAQRLPSELQKVHQKLHIKLS